MGFNLNPNDLDRYITGNYGEDQFRNLDRDDDNPNDMSAEDWAEFYGDEERMGMDFEDYLNHDHSMDY